MKNNKILFSIAAAFILLIACSKEIQQNQTTSLNAGVVSNAVTATVCDSFVYADTIFYPQSLPNDYVVKPLVKLSGTFGAFPDGLKINKFNGSIDVTESETGLKYIVWFLPTGSTDTCKKTITISGVNYIDSIYTLASSQNNAVPIYNADSTLAVPCNGCNFDDSNSLANQGVSINKKTGVLNLKRTINNGALGANPLNGTFKDYVLNYRIGDNSKKTRNTIGFRLYYYKKKSQIPDSLKNILAAKQSQVLFSDDGPNHSFSHHQSNTSGLTAKKGQGEVKCRPPYIIVTQN